MSRSLNKAMLIGFTGSDPEIRTTQGGSRMAKFSLATNESWTDRSDQKQEKVQWHSLTVWGKLVEVVEQWVHKGDRLYVEGRIDYSETTDDAGNKRYWTNIVVSQLIMLGNKNGGERRHDAAVEADDDRDLPF